MRKEGLMSSITVETTSPSKEIITANSLDVLQNERDEYNAMKTQISNMYDDAIQEK